MGIVTQTFTDYTPACGDLAPSLCELFAQTVVSYDGHYYLNFIYTTGACESITPYYTCDNNNKHCQEVLKNIFALDECGNLGIKAFLNLGSNQ